MFSDSYLDGFLAGEVGAESVAITQKEGQDSVYGICTSEAVVVVTHLHTATFHLYVGLEMLDDLVPYLGSLERTCNKKENHKYLCHTINVVNLKNLNYNHTLLTKQKSILDVLEMI